MIEFNAEALVRDNIKNMKAYSSARHEFSGEASIFMDANENPFGSPVNLPFSWEDKKAPDLNRYPDPLQWTLKEKISRVKGVPAGHIFLGNGSDEAIDLLIRIFCEPGRDEVIICPPTYGMYEVCAELNNVHVKKVALTANFQLDLDAIADAAGSFTKIIFICSPNNPTGNSIDRGDIEIVLNNFDGLVIIDEAYINYAKQKTFIPELREYPNLVILQTLSKAWGLAGLRLGMAFAGQEIISYLNKVKYPYNINTVTQQLALQALEQVSTVNEWIVVTTAQKRWLQGELLQLNFVQQVYPSDANFILVKMTDAGRVFDYLTSKGIIVRDRSKVILCDDCLRITAGIPEENQQLIQVLKEYAP